MQDKNRQLHHQYNIEQTFNSQRSTPPEMTMIQLMELKPIAIGECKKLATVKIKMSNWGHNLQIWSRSRYYSCQLRPCKKSTFTSVNDFRLMHRMCNSKIIFQRRKLRREYERIKKNSKCNVRLTNDIKSIKLKFT